MDDTRGYSSLGGREQHVDDARLAAAFVSVLKSLGERRKVLALPPDGTRAHSKAGVLLKAAYDHYGSALAAVMPALGTHRPLDAEDIRRFFPGVPERLFLPHDWRHDTVTLGTVPGSFVSGVSEGACAFSWPAQVNRLLVDGDFDLILSLGQVVPHEVVGMANRNKNVLVGCGGSRMINASHMLGAFYGMERIMGRDHTPVRKVFDYAEDNFLMHVPITYILTVTTAPQGNIHVHGLFIGRERARFEEAVALAQQKNLILMDRPIRKAVVLLDGTEFKSTWLGNKAVYRTRMAIMDGGELVVLAPGVDKFGEDKAIDLLIRKYGYKGREYVLDMVKQHEELRNNLSAAAHLIHGSSDDRFKITYCTRHLTREEVEGVGYGYIPYEEAIQRYNPEALEDGFQIMPDGEEIFYVSNPALGLWAERRKFE